MRIASIANQNSVGYSVSISHFTNIEIQNVNNGLFTLQIYNSFKDLVLPYCVKKFGSAEGAWVAKWFNHLPFSSKVASLKGLLNVNEPSSHVKEHKSTLCQKSWVLSGHSSFLPQGKLTGWLGNTGPQ